MNPEVKKLWTDALRSGEFEQGTGYLSQEGTYCCLGVLCELAIKAGVSIEKTTRELADFSGESYVKVDSYDHLDDLLPESVVRWAGLTSADPPLEAASNDMQSLSAYNDSGGFDFNEIADLIESQL